VRNEGIVFLSEVGVKMFGVGYYEDGMLCGFWYFWCVESVLIRKLGVVFFCTLDRYLAWGMGGGL